MNQLNKIVWKLGKKKIEVLACCDKFKGSLSSKEVNQAICEGLTSKYHTVSIPFADGGQGTLQMISNYIPGEWIRLRVRDPLFRLINSSYYLNGSTAYIEMAKTSGLQLIQVSERNIMKSSTFGLGQIIADCLNREQIKNIYLFIGGSATNDCGIGTAAALGYIFYNFDHQQLLPISENLSKIYEIDYPSKQMRQRIKQVKFQVFTDVNNVLYGQNGAAKVYGSQKGANLKMIEELDLGLKHFSSVIQNKFGFNINDVPGSGASGGLGAGAMIFLSAKIYSGTQKLIEISKLNEKIKLSDLIITGEGKLDKQTMNGKVVKSIIEYCSKQLKPLWIICGQSDYNQQQLSKIYHKIKLIQLVDSEISTQLAMEKTSQLIKYKIKKMSENQ